MNWSTICPSGFVVPTIEELSAELYYDKYDNFVDELDTPLTGYRDYNTGAFKDQNKSLYLASKTIDRSQDILKTSWMQIEKDGPESPLTYSGALGQGHTVRCIRALPKKSPTAGEAEGE